MSNQSSRTTVYLDTNLKKFIRHKAVADGTSVSKIINTYLGDYLEDLSDIAAIEERRGGPTIPFEEVLKDLGLTYDDLRDTVKQKSQ